MTYKLNLTEPEMDSLRWVAERYSSARILLEALTPTEEPEVYTVAEHSAWEYQAELDVSGEGFLPPCVGGTLAEKLITFLNGIV